MMETIKRVYNKNRQVFRILLIIALWLVFMALTKPKKFYSFKNFQTIASQFPEYGLMALGCMLCMMTGGIDLSCVGVANLTSILVVNMLIARFGADGTMPLGYTVVMFRLSSQPSASMSCSRVSASSSPAAAPFPPSPSSSVSCSRKISEASYLSG